ncbi:MAG: NAD(P)-dependent oxidoreductase [Nitriliruptorales bacterium]
MVKIAFLGLGQMGTPLATRLVQAGHPVTVWNRTPERTAPLVAQGATAASSPAEAAGGADVVITMLANSEALEEVLFGPEGLVSALSPGQLFMDMSTIGPRDFLSMASRLPEGVAAVDAPVRGSVPEATAGTLRIFVGASDHDFSSVRPLLETLGDVRHVGALGSGAAMKLVVNLTLGVSIVAFGEALALAKAVELDRDAVLDVLAESPIGPTVVSKRANVEADHYPPAFKLRHARKDMRLIDELSQGAGIDLVVSHAARQSMEHAMERGAADLDFSAVIPTILGQDIVRG